MSILGRTLRSDYQERKVVGGCTVKTVKDGAKWEGMDKLMIKEDFFASRSRVQPGLPDLSNLSLSRVAGRLIQLRLAESKKWHGLVLISDVLSLISWWWPGHRQSLALSGHRESEAGFQSGVRGPDPGVERWHLFVIFF